MNTQAYRRIAAKLQLSGREYLEGFSPADFAGITAEERAEIVGALQVRSRQGDGVALDALKQIMPTEEFRAFADALLREAVGDDLLRAQVITAIFDLSPGRGTWQQLLSELRHAAPPGRRWILNHIVFEQVSDQQKLELAAVLSPLISEETDDSLLLSEVAIFLLARGFNAGSQRMVDYARKLRDADRRKRLIALQEISAVQ